MMCSLVALILAQEKLSVLRQQCWVVCVSIRSSVPLSIYLYGNPNGLAATSPIDTLADFLQITLWVVMSYQLVL
jgi:hypothetical protein